MVSCGHQAVSQSLISRRALGPTKPSKNPVQQRPKWSRFTEGRETWWCSVEEKKRRISLFASSSGDDWTAEWSRIAEDADEKCGAHAWRAASLVFLALYGSPSAAIVPSVQRRDSFLFAFVFNRPSNGCRAGLAPIERYCSTRVRQGHWDKRETGQLCN